MSAHAARRLVAMAENVGGDPRRGDPGCRSGLRLPRTAEKQRRPRAACAPPCVVRVPRLDDDRYLYPDLKAATTLVREGALLAGLDTVLPIHSRSNQVSGWLTVRRGSAPLVLSIPHAGIDIPPEIEGRLFSTWLARKDTDWSIDRLYDLARRSTLPSCTRRSREP